MSSKNGVSEDPRGGQVIFIAGMAKSGTTILDQLLSTQPGVLGLGEIDHFVDDAKLFHPLARRYGPVEELPCTCGERVQACSLWGAFLAEFLDQPNRGYSERYHAVLRIAMNLADDATSPLIIVDSSKEVTALLRVASALHHFQSDSLALKVVVIYRDPRDWLVSDERRSTGGGKTRPLKVRRRRLRKWNRRYDQLLRLAIRENEEKLVVDLRDLQLDPEGEIRRLQTALGFPKEKFRIPDLSRSQAHIAWGSHHRLDKSSSEIVWRSPHLARPDLWLLPWILTPSIWPTALKLARLKRKH